MSEIPSIPTYNAVAKNNTIIGKVAAGGASGPAMPTTNLQAWWHSEAGVTKDGSDYVSTWTDQENSYTLSQGVGTRQPLWESNQKNGYAGITFDGTDDSILGGFGQLSGNLSVYIAFRWISESAADTIMWSNQSTAGFTISNQAAAGTLRWYTAGVSPTTPVTPGDYAIWGFSRNAGPGVTRRMRSNGDAELTDNYYNTNDTQGLSLGTNYGNTDWPANCQVYEVIVYSAQHVTSEMDDVMAYLNGKYAIY